MLRKVSLIFTLALAPTPFEAAAHAQTAEEYRVKAAFVYNLAKFVAWPAHTLKNQSEPIRICVLGQDPFGDVLDEAVRGKTVDNHPFAVSRMAEPQQAEGCQILFISSSERKRLRQVLDAVHKASMLTIGDTDGFAAEGGIVNFKLDGGHVRMQINPAAAGQAKLEISSKLLSLAEIVKPGL